MKKPGLVLMPALLLLATRAAGAELPADVAQFLERREACDHWRSEEPYDEPRRAEILANACKACAGTDAERARLIARYRNNAEVFEPLDALDAKVEPDVANDPCKPAPDGHASR